MKIRYFIFRRLGVSTTISIQQKVDSPQNDCADERWLVVSRERILLENVRSSLFRIHDMNSVNAFLQNSEGGDNG